jgi:hypothetical protein
MPDDPMADYFAAKREADGIVAGLRAAVASISAGTRALENWMDTDTPPHPQRKPTPKSPLDGLHPWPTWDHASDMANRYQAAVRRMHGALGRMSAETRATIIEATPDQVRPRSS